MISATFLRYLTVGLINTLMGYGVILLLQLRWEVHPVLANASGYAIGMTVSYVLNRRYTFRSHRNHAASMPIFVAATLLCYLLNVICLQFTMGVMHWPAAIAQAAAVLIYTVSFYFANRYWVFGPQDG